MDYDFPREVTEKLTGIGAGAFYQNYHGHITRHLEDVSTLKYGSRVKFVGISI
jgi:hypothetical protein